MDLGAALGAERGGWTDGARRGIGAGRDAAAPIFVLSTANQSGSVTAHEPTL